VTVRSDELGRLFEHVRELRAVVEAAVEGRLGQARHERDAARLSIGCYEIFGGDPRSRAARALVEEAARPRELVYGNDQGWRRLILDVHGDAVVDRPMREYDPSGLDPASLSRLEDALPGGFTLHALDSSLAAQLGDDLVPHALQVYESVPDFLAHGLGYGVVCGDRLASAATSYTRSSGSVEVAIATRPEFRGRGLAAAAAARLLRECMTVGLVPRWSASNPVSQRLALRLGYRPAGVCEVLYLR
jgi:GNAT superfamily N-acetyltransferase